MHLCMLYVLGIHVPAFLTGAMLICSALALAGHSGFRVVGQRENLCLGSSMFTLCGSTIAQSAQGQTIPEA